ncbi:MAG: type I-U CRISPR-associated protein Csx17 [Gemmataceae bacterium]|nr:type I-U CRISPR-associated protein Csx17 [Gemmata sp.]MDW8196194.1 type I-U CRISPR-associated protein Csx17 [Gemmataceae bacterium]
MTFHRHVLKGCAPTPLAHYLKALGILRLVGEQADPHARGWWDGEHFCLLSKLSQEELETFFLEKYEPTPLVSPWNKGCGFFKPNDPGLYPLENSTAPRFQRFRDGVAASRQLLNEISQADAAIRAIKARTKTTPKGFQTEQQRQLLETDPIYQNLLQQLREQRTMPGLQPAEKAKIESDLETIETLTRKTSKPPTKTQAEALKASAGYKRLLAAAERRFKTLKAALIPECQRRWRGPHADWLAAAVVLDEGGNPEWPSLLGTGGNDGNLDFTNNFMQQIGSLFETQSEHGQAKDIAKDLLQEALWSIPVNCLKSAAIGQFQPGCAGGANSSTGFDSGSLVNAWDFVLMLEGAVLFTSRATRRLDPSAFSSASAPFAVRAHAAGFATPGDENAQRGEQWMPLWRQPATLADIATMLGEARIQLDRQPANRPIDVACAISRLGVARGIEAFVRYGYLERNGQSTLAVALGRVLVRHHPQTHLIDDLAAWMNRVQRRCRDKNPPTRLVHAERRLADAVFAALTHDHTPQRWQTILRAAADIEAIQATGTAIDAGVLNGLRPEWVRAVDDNSPEFRLALALGSAAARYHNNQPSDPVRHHVLPLEPGGWRFQTAEKRLAHDPRVVVSGREPLRDLGAIVERRLIEAAQKGQRRSRLVAAAGCGARLDDVACFLRGAVDADRLFGLARAFMAIDWKRWDKTKHAPQYPQPHFREIPDECWLAVRLGCLPFPIDDMHDIPADERIVRLLLAGEAARAIAIARQRLQSVGIRPPMYAGTTDPVSARRWAAALAFPIHRATAQRAMKLLDPSKKGLIHA